MLSEFILPVVAYLITLLLLWAAVALTKLVVARASLPPVERAPRPIMIGTRTE
jgi:hypothetical protein